MVGVASETTQHGKFRDSCTHPLQRNIWGRHEINLFSELRTGQWAEQNSISPSTAEARPHTSLPVTLETLQVDLCSIQTCHGHASKNFGLENNPLCLERSQISTLHSAEDSPKARSWRDTKTVIKHIFCLSSVLLCILYFSPLERWMWTGALRVTPNCWKKHWR